MTAGYAFAASCPFQQLVRKWCHNVHFAPLRLCETWICDFGCMIYVRP
jgi:hypothetical protein